MSSPAPLPVASVPSLRRARPLLGTLVDIGIECDDSALGLRAIAAAFAEIATVHRLMSFHEAGSDLARLNRAAPGAWVPVDRRTAEVLRLADTLRAESEGVFDCAVADTLLDAALLPAMPATHASDTGAARADQVLVRRGAARLDLGGIAKGYAVDRAVAVLRACGVREALVNAGGDLRHVGAEARTIHLRDPADPSRRVGSVALRHAAVASSASSGLCADAGAPVAIVDPRRGAGIAASAGASISAPRCAIADALTKVVLVSGDASHPMLRRHGARVLLHRPGIAAPGP